jgi:hypothetical protein
LAAVRARWSRRGFDQEFTMKYLGLPLLAVTVVASCTYANVSSTPVLLPDGSTAYRYTGRANYIHQQAEADQVMAQTCAAQGKTPVIVAQDTATIGAGAVFGNGVAALGANRQQEILFRCI